MVNYVFVTAADGKYPLPYYGEQGAGCVTGVAVIREAFAEPPDNSETVLRFAKQGNSAVGTYFVRVKAPKDSSGSFVAGGTFKG